MSLPDKHDPRLFRHFAKLDAEGHVLAIVEVAEGAPDPEDHEGNQYVDVTHLPPEERARG